VFETLPNPSLDVVLIVFRGLLLIGAVCVFALAFIRWRRTDEQNTLRLQQQFERAFVELRTLHETVSVMSARIEALSERAEVGARLAPASVAVPQRGYDMATRLAKNGADVDELVTNCGITRHEAELLVRLHGATRGGGEVALGRLKQQAQESTRAPAALRPISKPQEHVAQEPPRQQGRKRGSLVSVVG
jgi:hypothetical protein